MKRLFGVKREKAPTPTLDEVNSNVAARGDTLDEKIRKLDQELIRHRDAIKRTRPGPAQEAAKGRAMRVLKQKRLLEGQRNNLYDQQFNLEQVAYATSSIKDVQAQVQAQKAATKELKTAFKKGKDLDIDAIESMQDEMADLMDMSSEIQDALGRSYNVPDEIDDEELMGELEGLEADLAAEAEAGDAVPSYLQDEPDLPAVPAGAETEAPAQEPVPVDAFGLPQKTAA